MNFNQLLDKFNTGINWNAYLYAIHKITSTLLVFLLYRTLETNFFAAWANINSIIFLILLWADLGFRKSIPRYAPEFLKNVQANKWFTRTLIIIQIILLTMLIPVLYYCINPIKNLLHIDVVYTITVIPVIFMVEGIISILRLIYHAHFQQKFFNILLSCILITETIINAAFIFTIKESAELVYYLFLNKAMMSSIAIVLLLNSLKKVYTSKKIEIIDSQQLAKDFVTHSGVMWLTTSLRSLSERNFMVPFLTYLGGPVLGSTFKIANDGALVFQRIVLKTIGTTDTSLLSYIQTGTQEKKLTEVAFRKLATKMATLCLPLLGIIGLLMVWFYGKSGNNLVFHIFCIISISYLLEAMLIPYERLLEVKREYKYLLGIYFFYSLLLFFLIISISNAWIGIRTTIALLSCVRLVSMLMMAYASRVLFNVHFPFKSFFILISKVIAIGLLIIPFLYIGSLLMN